jgi:D-aspartate ligase
VAVDTRRVSTGIEPRDLSNQPDGEGFIAASLPDVSPKDPVRAVPAIVFGASITALGVVRALHAHGVATFLVAPRTAIAARSRGVTVLAGGSTIGRSADSLRAFLSSSGFSVGVLVPCDDDWLRVIAEFMEGGGGSFTTAIPSLSIIETLVDKGAFARAIEGLDIDSPRTFDVGSTEDLDRIPDHELSSFFLKPRDSQRFTERYHQKAFRIADRERAAAQLERALEGGHQLVAQELIPGPPWNHVFIDGFVDRHGRVVGLLARRRIRMYPPRFGNSTDSVTIPLADVEDAADSLSRLFAAIRYHGLFDAEFKLDERSGRHRLIEVNARPWWQIELARAAGVDVVAMAYVDALGVDVAPTSGYRIGRRWIHTLPDLRARWEMRRSEPNEPIGEGWLAAKHAVFQWSDLRPGLAEVARVARVAGRIGLSRMRKHLSLGRWAPETLPESQMPHSGP